LSQVYGGKDEAESWFIKEKIRFEMKEILHMNSGHAGIERYLCLSKTGLSGRIYEFSCLKKLYLMIMYEY